jgi:uncharacterized protein YbcI
MEDVLVEEVAPGLDVEMFRQMQMHELNGMDIIADKKEVLSKLEENLTRHQKIVVEARSGYVEKARKALEDRLEKIKNGKLVSLQFNLSAPQDYSDIYRIAIKLLNMDQSSTVKLTPKQFRNLILDEWDWTDQFLATNAAYSATAAMGRVR